MLKRRGFKLILLSLALAVGAAWVARGWVQARLNTGKPDAGMQVVVAATEIPFGITVEARHLRVITLPTGAPIGEHFSKPDEVVGLVALQKVLSGEILLKQQFASHAAGSTLAALLTPQNRAITVRVDDVVGVAGFLLPGNHVDVVEARMVNDRAVTQTVLRDLDVLAVDQTDSRDKDSPVVVRAVTLEVTPPQAEVLVKAQTEGRIQLTLRSPNATNDSEPLTVESPPPPPKVILRRVRTRISARRDEGDAVTIIRGTNVERTHATG
jgi:pilus assembly protein CpaB